MIQINTYQAKKDLSNLLQKVEAGEKVIIANHNKPVAELVAIRSKRKTKRPFGLAKGEFKIPQSFFDPLPKDLEDAFAGK